MIRLFHYHFLLNSQIYKKLYYRKGFDYNKDFIKLQHVIFPQLQILRFLHECLSHKYLTKFLENNEKNLKELYLGVTFDSIGLINLAIANFVQI